MPDLTITNEGGGHVLTCECGWLRYFAKRGEAEAFRVEHAAKCKGKAEKAATPVARRSGATWDNREGATWIDQL